MKLLNGRVYKIVCSINDIVYIGSTFNTLRDRFQKHGSKSRCMISNYINELGRNKFKIILIKEYQVVDRAHLNAYEQLWINKTKCINRNSPFCIHKQYKKYYYSNNKEADKVRKSKFLLKNPDYFTNYYHANKEKYQNRNKRKVLCNTCDQIMTYDAHHKHKKTNKHIRNKENKGDQKWDSFSEIEAPN
jgi:hypothetical protein